jgi:hypothetical protein
MNAKQYNRAGRNAGARNPAINPWLMFHDCTLLFLGWRQLL